MEFIKNNKSFKIIDDGSVTTRWLFRHKNGWENDTFHILDEYANDLDGVYIDIGAWIGPTAIYSSSQYSKVIAIEPDPVALARLKNNIQINNCSNISIVDSALSTEIGVSIFGGNGNLGNSQSSLIVPKNSDLTEKNILKVKTITIDKIIQMHNINPENISLIKMDIEGGEKIVVPALYNLLSEYKPPLYISLPWCFLDEIEIHSILDLLFTIYNKCYIMDSKGNKTYVDKDVIKKNKTEAIVFESNYLSS